MAHSLLTETGSARRAYSQVLLWKTVKVKHETVEIAPRIFLKNLNSSLQLTGPSGMPLVPALDEGQEGVPWLL